MSSKTKKQQAQTTKNTAAISKASSLDLNKSLNALSTSGVTIQGTLSKISEELITQYAELQAVGDAITLKKAEMEALHGVDQILLTIDEARESHRIQLEEISKEQEYSDLKHRELVQQTVQSRARDEAEHNYNLQQQRKTEVDAWAEKLRLRALEERDRQEKFEKSYAEREAALRLKETAYSEALTRIANIDVEVKKESDKNVAIATAVMKKDYTHEAQMTAVKHEADLSKIKFDNQRLVEAANNMEKQILELQAQLKSAHEAQTQLAKDAVSAAANQKSISDMQSLMTNIGGNGTRPRS